VACAFQVIEHEVSNAPAGSDLVAFILCHTVLATPSAALLML
jgi:hypothetical protein